MIENQEGQAVEGQEGQGASGDSPAPATNQGTQNSPTTGANSGASEVPFHKNPEVQSFLDRQRKSQDREWSNRLSEMQKTYDQKFSDMQASMQNRSGQILSEKDASELRQLVKLIKSDPEAARELGITDLQSLKDEINSLRSSSSEQSIEREANSAVAEYATKYGYEPKQLEKDVWEFIKDDDYWANQPFSKGIFTKAMRDFFSDKQQELAERAANMKLVTENKNKNRAGSQKPLGNAQNTMPNAPKTMREAINQSMEGMKKEGVLFGA